MSKNKRGKAQDLGHPRLEQVSSASLIPPVEPAEPTEVDVDFANEEMDLAEQMKALKTKIAELGKRKKQAVGGKKLERMRKFATETAEWAFRSFAKFDVSIKRANDAVSKLNDYEVKLGIPESKQLSAKLISDFELGALEDAAETGQPARSEKIPQ